MLNPELVNACDIIGPAEAENPETEGEEPETVHAKVEPVTVDCRGMLVVEAEQIEEVRAGFVTLGFGLTVSTTL